jgi:hypothetical protein
VRPPTACEHVGIFLISFALVRLALEWWQRRPVELPTPSQSAEDGWEYIRHRYGADRPDAN